MPYTTKVVLRGILGEKFGREWRLALDKGNPAEALHAIAQQRPGFRPWLTQAAQDGIGLKVLIGGRDVLYHARDVRDSLVDGEIPTEEPARERFQAAANLLRDDLLHPCGKDSIEFVPEPVAAGGGEVVVIIIIIIAVLGLAWSVYQAVTAEEIAFGRPIGVRQDDFARQEEAEELGSYAFSGAVNKRGQSAPLALIFGRGFVGSHVGAFGINALDNETDRIADLWGHEPA
jgi:predicted phage tail protein